METFLTAVTAFFAVFGILAVGFYFFIGTTFLKMYDSTKQGFVKNLEQYKGRDRIAVFLGMPWIAIKYFTKDLTRKVKDCIFVRY